MKPVRHANGISVWMLVGALLLAAGLSSGYGQPYGLYLKADGGVNLVQDNNVRIGDSPGSLSLNAGYRFDGALGYEFNRWVAIELEGGLTDNTIDKVTLGGMVSTEPSDSSLTQIPLLVNVVARYDNESDFVPYIGAGAGGVLSSLRINGDKDEDALFGWQAKAGVIYKIDENAWLDVNYKFLSVDSHSYDIGAIPFKTEKIYNHFFGLSVIWKF